MHAERHVFARSGALRKDRGRAASTRREYLRIWGSLQHDRVSGRSEVFFFSVMLYTWGCWLLALEVLLSLDPDRSISCFMQSLDTVV